MTTGIVFQVETARVLQILAREIYDSPLALLRENVQNAYDAIRMRFAASGTLKDGGRIDIRVVPGEISITDNGIGMAEDVLRNNFWKAGSSGKHSDLARRSGVVGTFGIGAMANFGVASRLIVETRTEDGPSTLRSSADRDSLRLAEECVTLERLDTPRPVGTTVTAVLDDSHRISEAAAADYLKQYVSFLPVPVYLNDILISQNPPDTALALQGRTFTWLETLSLKSNLVAGRFSVECDSNGQLLIRADHLSLGGNQVEGSLTLVQSGGQLMAQRSLFGLAPMPAIGYFQLGGVANLSFLQPTAGREALSRESIDQVTQLLVLAEHAGSIAIAKTEWADQNNAFLQWLTAHNRYDLAGNVTVRVLPEDKNVKLSEVAVRKGQKQIYFYGGNDRHILTTFSSEETLLLHIAQTQPRRSVQTRYVSQVLNVPAVPDAAQVIKEYRPVELDAAEASILLRVGSILRDDYLIVDVEVLLADISHGVTVLPVKKERLKLYIARSSALLTPLREFYNQAYEIFTQFMKDFVRVHIYPRIQEHVPSSTRQGVDALRSLLQRNRELYRYEQAELGELEGLLGDYLSGSSSFVEVLQAAQTRTRKQAQVVSRYQVATIETVVPDVVGSPVVPEEINGAAVPAPPILREEVSSDMKVLTTTESYPQLNHFRVLLGLSDRLMRTEAAFFRTPHTTRILWGGHRVIYIFTEATGRLSLYYDIELRNPLQPLSAGGLPLHTTTLITKHRIFVPVPDALREQFVVAVEPREFFVRFDILRSDVS
jgi:molecular chaperone HtpG